MMIDDQADSDKLLIRSCARGPAHHDIAVDGQAVKVDMSENVYA